MAGVSAERIREAVRDAYGEIALADGGGCCGPSAVPCCTDGSVSLELGYSADDLAAVPEGADLGLGCGNPGALAALQPGETVLDLGSGAGFDAFLAARAVGPTGHVIGVDMTPAMVSKARANAAAGDYPQVEFRLGEIEHLPVADATVDVIISNCAVNLSTDKPAVFGEAFRVLKPGGRLAISDVVAFADLPDDVRGDLGLYSGCMAGASLISELEAILHSTGFVGLAIEPKDESRSFIERWAPGRDLTEYVVSATIEAVKPSPGHVIEVTGLVVEDSTVLP